MTRSNFNPGKGSSVIQVLLSDGWNTVTSFGLKLYPDPAQDCATWVELNSFDGNLNRSRVVIALSEVKGVRYERK
jgi:hypothetical protein